MSPFIRKLIQEAKISHEVELAEVAESLEGSWLDTSDLVMLRLVRVFLRAPK